MGVGANRPRGVTSCVIFRRCSTNVRIATGTRQRRDCCSRTGAHRHGPPPQGRPRAPFGPYPPTRARARRCPSAWITREPTRPGDLPPGLAACHLLFGAARLSNSHRWALRPSPVAQLGRFDPDWARFAARFPRGGNLAGQSAFDRAEVSVDGNLANWGQSVSRISCARSGPGGSPRPRPRRALTPRAWPGCCRRGRRPSCA